MGSEAGYYVQNQQLPRTCQREYEARASSFQMSSLMLSFRARAASSACSEHPSHTSYSSPSLDPNQIKAEMPCLTLSRCLTALSHCWSSVNAQPQRKWACRDGGGPSAGGEAEACKLRCRC
jgi:hypothetical protein